MKKLFINTLFLLLFISCLLLLTGCSSKDSVLIEPTTPDSVISTLLDNMIRGNTNEAAIKYCANPSILVIDRTTKNYELSNAIFSKLSYKIKSSISDEVTSNTTVSITTIDLAKIKAKSKELLTTDSQYQSLSNTEKSNYELTKQIDLIKNTTSQEDFITTEIIINLSKYDNSWLATLNDDFILATLGISKT